MRAAVAEGPQERRARRRDGLGGLIAGPASALGDIIRRQRELNELSVRRFASMVGISNPYLSQIERGLRAPSERVLEAIARTLETSVDSLYEQAGFAPEDEQPAVARAIAEDPKLSARQKRTLLDVYESFAGVPSRRPRRRE